MTGSISKLSNKLNHLVWFQLLICEDFIIFFVSCYNVLNILGVRTKQGIVHHPEFEETNVGVLRWPWEPNTLHPENMCKWSSMLQIRKISSLIWQCMQCKKNKSQDVQINTFTFSPTVQHNSYDSYRKCDPMRSGPCSIPACGPLRLIISCLYYSNSQN